MREFEDDQDLEGGLEGEYEYENGFLNEDDFKAMGIDPIAPTEARPGSEAKVLMLSARYAAGVPLWHNYDCYDHGPRESELMGSSAVPAPPQPLFDPEADE